MKNNVKLYNNMSQKLVKPKLINLARYAAQSPWGKLDPFNDVLYPAIIKDNFNHNNKARLFLDKNFIIGRLHHQDLDPYWSLASPNPLSHKDLLRAKSVAEAHDEKFNKFQYVSGISLTNLPKGKQFKTKAHSQDHYAYIYDIDEVSEMNHKHHSSLRRYVKKFVNSYGHKLEITLYDSLESLLVNKDKHQQLHSDWIESSDNKSPSKIDELRYFKNFLFNPQPKVYRDPLFIEVSYGGHLVGVSINDVVSENTAINYYHFGNLNISGISYFLLHYTAKCLRDRGVKYFNFQEDCGSLGLRNFKQKMAPIITNKLFSLSFL